MRFLEKMLKITASTVVLAILLTQAAGQECVECATGCAETTPQPIYGNLKCSCPTGSKCISSGGLCTTCTAGGPAYGHDDLNNCGGTYNLKGQNNCGCNGSCIG